MAMIERQAISYKDPDGFIIKRDDGFYRHISESYKKEYDHLMLSGLYDGLVKKGLMISHTELDTIAKHSDSYKEIFPQQILFINYPFEWSFSQWRQMLLSYISISRKALAHDMILKDATPYNFTFFKGKCVMIDTSSFDFYTEGDTWKAYRQFCEEILAPVTLMYYCGPLWSKLYSASITGLPLSFVKEQLPFKSRFNACTLLHIHWHAKYQKAHAENKPATKTFFSKQKLEALFNTFENAVIKWKEPISKDSIWNKYYEKDIQTDAYLEDKIDIVTNWLSKTNPETTVDIGANTGMFSFIAAQYSANVIAAESDILCVDIIYKTAKQKKIKNVVAIVTDIAEPFAGLGWNNEEKISLLQRLKGDMVMALAVIHHICITRNVPMPFAAKLFSQITSSYAIVEFVPKTDEKVKVLLQNREDIFSGYTEDNFIDCFRKYFSLINSHTCKSSGRKLFLWQKL
jgi:hypothetical protein